uniref:DDE Tnp4 domain-containing protein n=1 Tax=Cyprinus carpio carpio TaxID=630221 RepID=A0A9J8BH80_CYPCA
YTTPGQYTGHFRLALSTHINAASNPLFHVVSVRRIIPYPQSDHWWDTIIEDFTPIQFLRVKHVMGRRNTNYRLCVPVCNHVAVAIWKLAIRTISNLFGVGLSTVCNCLEEFCNTVIKVRLPVHLRFPDADKLLEMASFFNNQWRVPQCVGSVHDARVLGELHLWDVLSDEELLGQNKVTICGCDVGHYLIGDPAYPMQNWFMKPFSDTGRLTPEQHTYNYRLRSARSVVEMSFGKLKGRWRCLLKRNDCKLELSKKMALICCVLHNICEEHGDNFTEEHPDGTVNIQAPVRAFPNLNQTFVFIKMFNLKKDLIQLFIKLRKM